jgi:hypothetical protein
MKYMRIISGYTWTDHETNKELAKDLNITPVLDYKKTGCTILTD